MPMRESTSEMSLIVAELEPRMPRNKITGANAGGVIRLQIRTRRAARIAQFRG